MTQPLPQVAQAYRIFAQEERHREVAQLSASTESLAFAADRSRGYKFQQGYGGSGQSYDTNNSTFQKNTSYKNISGTKRPGSNYYCTNCKIPGHSIERCFRIHGFPAGFKGYKDKKVAAASTSYQSPTQSSQEIKPESITLDQYNHLLSLLHNQPATSNESASPSDAPGHALLTGTHCLLTTSTSEWLLDSGAFDHICTNLSWFHDYKSLQRPDTITIPDGRQIPVAHIGSVALNDHIILHNVLHVPDFAFNLISIHQLCKDLKCQIFFHS